jgi:hypothetical protein
VQSECSSRNTTASWLALKVAFTDPTHPSNLQECGCCVCLLPQSCSGIIDGLELRACIDLHLVKVYSLQQSHKALVMSLPISTHHLIRNYTDSRPHKLICLGLAHAACSVEIGTGRNMQKTIFDFAPA